MARRPGWVGAIALVLVAANCTGNGSEGDSTSGTPSSAGGAPTSIVRPVPAPGQLIVARRLMVGWWDGTTWQQAGRNRREPADPEVPLVLGSRYTFVAVDGRRISRTLGTSTSECIGPEEVYVDVPDDVADMVGVAEGIEPLRRPVVQIGAAPAHRESVQAWLAGEGVADTEVSIDRVTRADLEGDGVDEVLIEASYIPDKSLIGSPAGNYSVVLLRHVAGGGAGTTLVRGDVVTETEARANDFAGGYLYAADLVAIADLDGDGWLEVVVATRYFEGSGVAVYAWDGNRLDDVLVAGCGA